MMTSHSDFLIIGGGIVGVATGLKLTEAFPSKTIRVLEKEPALARHQSGNNSGVIHAGVYYEPGSLKAKFCRTGSALIEGFCEKHKIRVKHCGKLIVATNSVEVDRLRVLMSRCEANGLKPIWLDRVELKALEPNVLGVAAIRVVESAITDYQEITLKMAELFCEQGNDVTLNADVHDIQEGEDAVLVSTSAGYFSADYLIVCGGLMADRLARHCGIDLDFKIVSFRGEYFKLPPSKNKIVSHMIYPVPDPALPFLGIHLTPTIDGGVTVGPNAVLALAREGYKWRDVNLRDLINLFFFRGFRSVIKNNWKSGISEIRNSIFVKRYLKECQKYCPSLKISDLTTKMSGVRAQAVLVDGTMVHDFLLCNTARTLHVCNAPSPAATSSLAIGEHIVQKIKEEFKLINEESI